MTDPIESDEFPFTPDTDEAADDDAPEQDPDPAPPRDTDVTPFEPKQADAGHDAGEEDAQP
jgi:hypothetical protein